MKLWPRRIHSQKKEWRPEYQERQKFLAEKDLVECPVTDISVGDIVLDVYFSKITNRWSCEKSPGHLTGINVDTVGSDGEAYQGFFYPEETILVVNPDSYITEIEPIKYLAAHEGGGATK